MAAMDGPRTAPREAQRCLLPGMLRWQQQRQWRLRQLHVLAIAVVASVVCQAYCFVPPPGQHPSLKWAGLSQARGVGTSRAAASMYNPDGPHSGLLTARLDRPRVDHSNPALLTQALQMMHLSIIAALVCVPWLLDVAVLQVWRWFDSLLVTHSPMFEAHLAVASFTLSGLFFELLHNWWPNAQSHRLDNRPPVRPLQWLPFGHDAHKAAVPAVTYLGGIALFHYFSLGTVLFGTRPIFDDPTFLRVAVEVSLGVFLYDLLFYPFHYSFHNVPFAPWRRLHHRHHEWARKEVAAHNAIETVQNGFADVTIQVAINIFVQQLSPWGCKHPLSRALHNIMVTYLLVEAHSGYDLPFMSHRLFPGVFGGSPRHEAHHRVGSVYYHQFFTYIDDFFGFTNQGSPDGNSKPGAESAEQSLLVEEGKAEK